MWHVIKKLLNQLTLTRDILDFKSIVLPTGVLIILAGGVSGCLLDYQLTKETDTDTNVRIETGENDDPDDDGSEDVETESSGDTETIADSETVNASTEDTDEDTEEDTEEETNVISDTETNGETEYPSCPSGLDFTSQTVFTELINGSSIDIYEYHDSCEEGQVIVGFHGFLRQVKNLVHGKIQALCAEPAVLFEAGKCVVATEGGTTLPLRGDEGNVEWTRMCPQNEIVVGYRGMTGADIDQITFVCASLRIVAESGGYAIALGERTFLESAGGAGGNYEAQDQCPDGQVATSSLMLANNVLVNAFGLGCQVPSLIR